MSTAPFQTASNGISPGILAAASAQTHAQTQAATQAASTLTIDPEFQALVVPMSAAERELLTESIKTEGCLEPLYFWKNDEQRILLDGHNRYEICTTLGRGYQTRRVDVSTREEAKLWILEHQAGRRNLTDDQRAIVWNEIREQRSKVISARQLEAARETRISGSAKITESGKPSPFVTKLVSKPTTKTEKTDTRAAVAKEAGIPENKIRQAQVLKKHQPDLYKKVLSGEIKLRDTSKESKKSKESKLTPKKRRLDKADFYHSIGHSLHNLYRRNDVGRRLHEIARIQKSEWSPEAEKGIRCLLKNLADIDKETAKHRAALKAVLKRFA